jgi:HSP20 family protein
MATNGKEKGGAVAVRKSPGMLAWPDDVEQLFDRAFRYPFVARRRPFWPALRREATWLPDMDVFERDGKTVVRLDLPGIKRENISVTVDNDMLLISGHRKEEKEMKEENYYCSERATGEFSRGISLPEGVKAEEIEATYQDGVLEVIVPKAVAATETSVKVPVK